MTSYRPNRYWLAQAIAHVAAGCVMTVAVSWILSMCYRTPSFLGAPGFYLTGLFDRADYRIANGPGETFVWTDIEFKSDRAANAKNIDFPVNSAQLPAWSWANALDKTLLPGVSPGGSLTVEERATGWPFRAMVERQFEVDDGPVEVLATLSFIPPWQRYRVWLPLMPLWRGFLLNTLVFGTALFLLSRGVTFLHSRFRHQLGLCSNCRYSLTGLTSGICPECGRAFAHTQPA